MTQPQDQHDPGGKVRLKLPDGTTGSAEFSECGRYRHLLTRDWTPQGERAKSILFIGMNPSVADGVASDPTCRREETYTKDWGYTRYLKANMLDWRATSPKDIPAEIDLARSSKNLPAILDAARECEIIILAYGKLHARYHETVAQVIAALRCGGHNLQCLGLNADGSAKHPLYLKKTLKPFPFPE